MGKMIPLGSERLKICELFAEFIHLQYLFSSSPLFDMMAISPDELKESKDDLAPKSKTKANQAAAFNHNLSDKDVTVTDGLIVLTEKFIEEKVLEKCIVNFIFLSLFRIYFFCFRGTILFILLYMT